MRTARAMGVSSTSIGAPTPAASLVDAGIHGESVQPRIEPVGFPKLREVAPGSDQPLLDRVACELGVTEDQARGLVQPHDGGAGELGEGVMIASPRTLHEPSLVHGRLVICPARPGWSCSQGMASSLRERFFRRPATRRRGPYRRCR